MEKKKENTNNASSLDKILSMKLPLFTFYLFKAELLLGPFSVFSKPHFWLCFQNVQMQSKQI